MNPNLSDWDEDLPPEPEEAYQDLVRALKRKQGFGLFFVQCTPVEAEPVITKLPQDIPEKNTDVLRLVEPINNLYSRVKEFTKDKQINILLIKGLEYSLYKYEKRNFGEITEGKFSNLTKVPPILNHLNQQRERFREDFSFCLVFLLGSFSINYLIHRAPDFFDWRSGVFELPASPELLKEQSSRLLLEGDYEEYLQLTPEQKIEKLLEFQELLEEKHYTDFNRADLLFKLGNLLVATNEYEAAILTYDEAVKVQPNLYLAWYNLGLALRRLGRYEEAIASFDRALKIKPDFHSAWNNRGAVLSDNLQKFEDAIVSFDQAVKIEPELHEAWFNQGIALLNSGKFEKAIASFDKALAIKPNDHKAWYARGNALYSLKSYNEALKSYNKAIDLNPDYAEGWYFSESALCDDSGYDEEASSSNKKQIDLFVENYNFLYKLESLVFGVVSYKIPSLASKIAEDWRKRLAIEYSQQSETTKESIISWLLGSDLERFELLNTKELDIAKQAMEYRYRILCERYLDRSRDRSYRNLMSRLASLVSLRNKIQTWISLSRDTIEDGCQGHRKRSVIGVLQEVVQELLQTDTYMLLQMATIAKLTAEPGLKDALLFASVEEYCLRPVRNQPLLVYRFVNYLRRTQRGGLTQVPGSHLIQLMSDKVLTDDSDNYISSADQAIAHYQETQELEEQKSLLLRTNVKVEFEEYLHETLGDDAVKWLRLYLQGKSQDAIAKELNKPIKEVYRLREKISYRAIRVFALQGKPELIDAWLGTSLEEHNLGLKPKQRLKLYEQLTPIQRQILEQRKKGHTIESIAKSLNIKVHEAMGEWTKIFLAAQALRSQED